MGVTIRCKKTGRETYTGYIRFDRLRTKVAELVSPEVGAHYRELNDILRMSGPERGRAERLYDEETEKLIDSGALHPKIAGFLYQSDTTGSVRYGACAEILKVIGDYNSDGTDISGNVWSGDAEKFSTFKAILQDCVNNKCSMTWM